MEDHRSDQSRLYVYNLNSRNRRQRLLRGGFSNDGIPRRLRCDDASLTREMYVWRLARRLIGVDGYSALVELARYQNARRLDDIREGKILRVQPDSDANE